MKKKYSKIAKQLTIVNGVFPRILKEEIPEAEVKEQLQILYEEIAKVLNAA